MVYLLATSGVLVGQHLCMDRVKETALFKKVERQCGMSAEMHQDLMHCCEDQWSLEKVEDDQQISDFKTAPKAKFTVLYAITFGESVSSLQSQEDEIETHNTGPPDIAPPDLPILYHNLKIPAALQS